MKNRTTGFCKPGYWTTDAETIAGENVTKLTATLASSIPADTSSSIPVDLADKIYLSANQVFKLLNDGNNYPFEKVQIIKSHELMIHAKDHSGTAPHVLYHVTCDDRPDIHFFIITNETDVLAYARVHQKDKYSLLQDVYGDQSIATIEAIQSYVQTPYSYGTLLIQIAFEFSLNHGYGGRIGLYSVKSSSSERPAGQFFFKTGFTPLDSDIFDDLNNGYDLVGEHMFLTDTAIAAWTMRVNENRILFNVMSEKDDEKPMPPLARNTSTMFVHNIIQQSNAGTTIQQTALKNTQGY